MLIGMSEADDRSNVRPTVRRAIVADVPSIVAMLQQIHDQHLAWDAARWTTREPPHLSYADWIDELTARPTAGGVWVAQSEGRIAGYALAEVEPESTRHWMPEAVYFHDIYVAPDFRRTGVASALLSAVLDWSRDIHPSLQVRLTTAAANQPARDFFATFGFRPCAIEMIRE